MKSEESKASLPFRPIPSFAGRSGGHETENQYDEMENDLQVPGDYLGCGYGRVALLCSRKG